MGMNTHRNTQLFAPGRVKFVSQCARDAQDMGYGGEAYCRYLDAHAVALRDYFLRLGDPVRAREMMTRSLSESLQGNDGV